MMVRTKDLADRIAEIEATVRLIQVGLLRLSHGLVPIGVVKPPPPPTCYTLQGCKWQTLREKKTNGCIKIRHTGGTGIPPQDVEIKVDGNNTQDDLSYPNSIEVEGMIIRVHAKGGENDYVIIETSPCEE